MKQLNLLFLFIFFFLEACSGSLVQSTDSFPQPPEHRGYLQIRCQPYDAEIYIDGVFRGYLDGYVEGVLLVPEGHHRLTVQKPGYYAQHQEIDISEQELILNLALIPQPPQTH